MKTLGLYIHKARKQAGMTLKEVAQRCGVSIQAVWYWERDIKKPELEKLWAIANALGLDLHELITERIESGQ